MSNAMRKVQPSNTPSFSLIVNENSPKADPLDEIWHFKPVRQHVRDFGALFGALLVGFAAVSAYRHGALELVGALTIVGLGMVALGRFAPVILKPFWRSWMTMAEGLGVVMTFLIRAIVWSVAILPIAACLRILRIRVMNMTFREPTSSYWEERPDKLNDFQLLKRQF